MCESCHGNAGVKTGDLTDISRMLNPNNASYHPVEAPTLTPSPSIAATLRGQEINCTDCHDNDDPAGPRGPHGSLVAGLLGAGYIGIDGTPEAPSTYALCYRCHDRTVILEKSPFPAHGEHVIKTRASCATCHNPHGAVHNRALVRFGEETSVVGVAPSKSGRLAFVSTAAGSGSCYLTCHGKDHDPLSYGSASQTGPLLDASITHSVPGRGPAPAATSRSSPPALPDSTSPR